MSFGVKADKAKAAFRLLLLTPKPTATAFVIAVEDLSSATLGVNSADPLQ
jgi:hypothetical protein